ncbi:MAG TPA: hypothetical protein VH309_13155 [Elusimicrobiota bacterium]|nr:hypothetical protein [Elusimicrobiota bacterium]
MRTLLGLSCVALAAALSWGQSPAPGGAPDVVPETTSLKRFIRERIDAEDGALARRPTGPRPPAYAGLPAEVRETLPEDDGFVLAPRVPGETLVANVDGLDQAGLKLEDAVEDEEWARLPDGAVIRRELERAPNGETYTIWRYPRGTRLVHRIFLKPTHRLVELRLEQKLEDDSGGRTGAWAFGVYRSAGPGEPLRLYRPGPNEDQESVRLPMPNGFGAFKWTRLSYDSCRACHISMGPGWYQYSDEAGAGPCGFVPSNRALRADWARRYRARHGYSPFAGD